MDRTITIILLFLFFFNALFAQKENAAKIFDDAEFFFIREDYKEAVYLFLEVLKTNPENANINYRVGMSYLNMPGLETKAIPYLEKAVENTTLKYKERDFTELKAPHHSWFYLGNAYRISNDLNEALTAYQHFTDIRKFEKKYNLRIVENEIKAVERAKIIQDSPLNLEKKNPGSTINNGLKNYQPVVNPGETTMVFVRELKFYNAIMMSEWKNGAWQEALNITPLIGSDGDMVPTGLSSDGNSLLLIKRSGNDKGDIYLSKKTDNIWGPASKLGENVNTSRNEDHASFSADGKTIYFSSNRRGGMGGLDLYKSSLLEDGTWGKAENLGPHLNTSKDETAVFSVEGGKKLIFSSKGHYNMGGYDLFYVQLKEDGKWGNVINYGYPINTTNDNKFFQPLDDGNSGYLPVYISDGPNIGGEEIYRVKILPRLTTSEVSR